MGVEHFYKAFLFLAGIQSAICIALVFMRGSKSGDEPDYTNFMLAGFSLVMILFAALLAISQNLGYYKIIVIGG